MLCCFVTMVSMKLIRLIDALRSSVAMEGVREALATAQEAADGACLAHAAAWGALAGGRARRAALLSRVPRPPRAAASAVQLMAQHAAVNAARPAEVFQVQIVNS